MNEKVEAEGLLASEIRRIVREELRSALESSGLGHRESIMWPCYFCGAPIAVGCRHLGKEGVIE